MGRSLSYYGVETVDYEYKSQLVRDMVESWGDDLSGINQKTTLFLIALLASRVVDQDASEIDPNVQEVISRIDELSEHDMVCLIQSLAN